MSRRARIRWALITVCFLLLLVMTACTARRVSPGGLVSSPLASGTHEPPEHRTDAATPGGDGTGALPVGKDTTDASSDNGAGTEGDDPTFDPEDVRLTGGFLYLYDAEKLVGASTAGVTGQSRKANGASYMRYQTTAASSAVLVVGTGGKGTVLDGRYVRIKYRTSTESSARLTVGREMLTDRGASTVELTADGQWRVTTVDLFENRCYDSRIDLMSLGFTQKGATVDVEWIAVYPDDGAPYASYDPLAGLPPVPPETEDLTAYRRTPGGSARYQASGYPSAEGDTFTVTDGLHLDVHRRRYFNRYTLLYSATAPMVGEITYLWWDKDGGEQVGRETFYLEAGENRSFASLIDGFFQDVYAYAVTGIDLRTCRGDMAEFTLTDISTNVAPVPASGSYYLENERYRVGILLAWGGGISYIEDKRDGDDSLGNLINRADTGRLVQQSYYGVTDGPDYKAGMYGSTLWRYNPVQGGDLYGNPSKLVDFGVSENGKSFYVKCRPMDWAKRGELTPAYMENTYTIKWDAILVDNRFVDFFGVKHGAHHFELPAFYTVSYLGTFHYYDGSAPWTGAPYRTLPNEGFWGGNGNAYHTVAAGNTETWAAWTAENGYGIGIYTPGAEILLAGRHEPNGSKDPASTATSYVAPLRTMEIVSYEPFEYSYIITTGQVDKMREVFAEYAGMN